LAAEGGEIALGDNHFAFGDDGHVDKRFIEESTRQVVQGAGVSDFARNGGVATLIPSPLDGVLAQDKMLKLGGKVRKVWQERHFFLTWYGLGWYVGHSFAGCCCSLCAFRLSPMRGHPLPGSCPIALIRTMCCLDGLQVR
jgi:hypothetical protein